MLKISSLWISTKNQREGGQVLNLLRLTLYFYYGTLQKRSTPETGNQLMKLVEFIISGIVLTFNFTKFYHKKYSYMDIVNSNLCQSHRIILKSFFHRINNQGNFIFYVLD